MRVNALGLAAVALAACCPEGYESIQTAAPTHADEAVALIRAEFAAEFGTNPDVRVRWTHTAPTYDGMEYSGVSYGCEDIWVHVNPGQPIHSTALVHELAHCFNGDIGWCGLQSDNSHTPEWIWGDAGLVVWMNSELKAKGF